MNRSGLGLSLVSAPETFNNNNYNFCDAGRTLGVIYQLGQAQACYSIQGAWFIYNTIHYTYLCMCSIESSCFSDIHIQWFQPVLDLQIRAHILSFCLQASQLYQGSTKVWNDGWFGHSFCVLHMDNMPRRQLISYFRGQITSSGGGYVSSEE